VQIDSIACHRFNVLHVLNLLTSHSQIDIKTDSKNSQQTNRRLRDQRQSAITMLKLAVVRLVICSVHVIVDYLYIDPDHVYTPYKSHTVIHTQH